MDTTGSSNNSAKQGQNLAGPFQGSYRSAAVLPGGNRKIPAAGK